MSANGAIYTSLGRIGVPNERSLLVGAQPQEKSPREAHTALPKARPYAGSARLFKKIPSPTLEQTKTATRRRTFCA
ncbi:MAG TPA: hypothetical protein VN612_01160, partial [Acidobacteriaceae bacterium]|nr:hypothetical protein [Acidobacteriaceae bacterium]